MATKEKPAVATPSVPVSTGRLIPWSTEEDELLRQVRRPQHSAAPLAGGATLLSRLRAHALRRSLRAYAHASRALARPHRAAAARCAALGCSLGR
jgi:hypothetical protein